MSDIPDLTKLLLDVAAELPGWQELGGGGRSHTAQGTVNLGFDKGTGVWELEICALDPARNVLMTDPNLLPLVDRLVAWLAGEGE